MQMRSPKDLPSIPVAPGAWPVLGHLPHLVREQPEFLLRTEKKVGPVYWLNQGFGIWTVVVTGELARTVMKNKATRSDIMGMQGDHITGHTLLVNDGAEHKRMRGAMNAPFTPKGLTSSEVGALLRDVSMERVAPWAKRDSVTILNETSEFALGIIFQMLGIDGLDLPLWRKKFNEFIGPWIIVPTTLPGSPRWKSRKAAEWMDKRFIELIKKAREEGEQETMLGALAHGTDEEGKGLEDHELLANLRILALAGHETTAATIAWMFIRMAGDPALWAQIRDEVMSVDELPATPKDMGSFPLTEALFREALRVYPVVALLPPRRVAEPIEYEGGVLPENTRVSASLLSLSRDEGGYEDPETLDISRWKLEERKPKLSEAAQFGGGPHFCLGYHLAVMEGVIYTAAGSRRSHKQA